MTHSVIRSVACGLAVLAFSSITALPAVAATPDPVDFVRTVVTQCGLPGNDTTLDARADDIYDADTLALMGADARITPSGEVGIFSDDPVCDYLDYGDIDLSFSKLSSTAATATVEVVVAFRGVGDGPHIDYQLTLSDKGWRIHDINRPGPGLREVVSETQAPTALALLQNLYSHYKDSDELDFSAYQTVPGWFDPAMTAVIMEDRRLADGDIGAVDADPVCQCQDYDGFTATFVTTASTDSTATIVASLHDKKTGAGPKITYQMVRIGNRWRIHDIASDDYPSLYKVYADSNATYQK